MNELISITQQTIGDSSVNAVNARDLWRKLESKQEFTNWVKNRLELFVENQDYISFDNSIKRESGGATVRKEYILTLDVAKHIAMLERTEVGRKIRQYFIDVEKQKLPTLPDFTDPAEAAIAWAKEYKEKQKALAKIERDKPKVEFSERIEVAINSINIGSYAKAISKEHGIKVGQNKLFAFLRDNDILIKSGRRKNFPTAKYMENGYFEVKTSPVTTANGIREVHVTLITGRGQIGLINKIVDHFSNKDS